jgi:hypothetical protein
MWAWGREGHRIIASLAQQRLAATNPEALKAIRKLIGPHRSLAELSACADDIRDYARRRTSSLSSNCLIDERDIARYSNTESWHFINLPTASRGSITSRIDFFTEQLGSTRLTNRTRAVALMFLTHLVGDVHQPLHAISRNGDKGGNSVFVRIGRRVMTLHAAWDTVLVDGRSTPSVVDADRRTPEAWAWESFELARTIAYRGVPDRSSSPSNPIVLPSEYRSRAEACIQNRLYVAGIRLADLIANALRAFPATGE